MTLRRLFQRQRRLFHRRYTLEYTNFAGKNAKTTRGEKFKIIFFIMINNFLLIQTSKVVFKFPWGIKTGKKLHNRMSGRNCIEIGGKKPDKTKTLTTRQQSPPKVESTETSFGVSPIEIIISF